MNNPDIRIVYEDNHVLVAVKPVNMLSQADNTGDADILTRLKDMIKERDNKPGNVYLGLVHRLDRPVGGLMVFAKTSKAAARLSAQLQAHQIGREYLCIADGVTTERFDLTDWLIKDEKRNMVTVCSPDRQGAKKAVLHGTTLASDGQQSLCAICLETGRNHQIRVQMAHSGHALWGDNRYGRGKAGQQIALWGYKLTIDHPTKHELMTFYDIPHGSNWDSFSAVLQTIEQA